MIKKTLKIIGLIVLIAVVFYLGAEVGFQMKYKIELWKTNKAAEEFNNSIFEIFKADIYGGKTPEETYNLLVEALKNEDVDLASKYIVLDPERRQSYYEQFDEMKQKGELKAYGEGLPKWEEFEQVKDEYNDWESRATIEYGQEVKETITVYDPFLDKETIIEPGIYGKSIVFIKNSNSIWKIESF